MALFNLSVALTQLSTASITVRRPSTPGFGTDGTAQAPTFTTFTNVRTSFQNLKGDELKNMPEGKRTTSWQKIWPQMQVLPNDRIVHPTKGTFLVEMLDDCADEGGFTAAFVRKLGDGES